MALSSQVIFELFTSDPVSVPALYKIFDCFRSRQTVHGLALHEDRRQSAFYSNVKAGSHEGVVFLSEIPTPKVGDGFPNAMVGPRASN